MSACGWKWPLIPADACMRACASQRQLLHGHGGQRLHAWRIQRLLALRVAGLWRCWRRAVRASCTALDVCVHVGTPVRVAPQVAIRSGRVGLHHCVVGGIHAVRLQLRRQRGRPQWPSVASPCCARSKGSACCTWWRSRHSRAAAFIRVDGCIYAGALQRWLWWSMDAWLARSRFTGVVGGRAVCALCIALDVCVHVGAPVRVADRVATRSGGISFA